MQSVDVNPERYNVALAEFIQPMCGELPLPYVLDKLEYGLLRKRFPQFNPQSKVHIVEDGYMVRLQFLYSAFGSVRRRTVPMRLRGIKTRLWRALGELFDKPLWLARGYKYVADPAIADSFERTVKLEPFGLEDYYPGLGFFSSTMQPSVRIDLAIGYEPLEDTLYVRRLSSYPEQKGEKSMKREDDYLMRGMEVLAEAMKTGDPSGAIVNQEKRGQATFVGGDTLPIKINGATREQLETIGFGFGEPVDDLFLRASLPKGWTKRPTEHQMWSEILDDQGRLRISVFFKAAFYDRDAFMNVDRRYRYGVEPVTGYGADYDKDAPDVARVWDQQQVIWEGKAEDHPDIQKQDAMSLEAKTWLVEQFPDWENAIAYWDQP